MELDVRGADDVGDLVKAIRTHADAKALRRELNAGLNRATKQIRAQMVKALPDALPQRGGLAEQVQKRVSASTTAKSGKYAGVSMRFRSRGYDLRMITEGRIRHPVFGRSAWVTQTTGVEPEAFMGEFDKQKPEIQEQIMRVLEDVARKVAGS